MAINNKYLHTVYSHSIIGLLHTVRFVVNLLNSGFLVQHQSGKLEFISIFSVSFMSLSISGRILSLYLDKSALRRADLIL